MAAPAQLTPEQTTDKVIFEALGLDTKRVLDTVKNTKLSADLREIAKLAGVTQAKPCDKAIGNLLYSVATEFPKAAEAQPRKSAVVEYIAQKKIVTKQQLLVRTLFDFS